VVGKRVPLGYARKGGALNIGEVSWLDELIIFRPGLSKLGPQRRSLVAHPLLGDLNEQEIELVGMIEAAKKRGPLGPGIDPFDEDSDE
jgi:hypothetical protein